MSDRLGNTLAAERERLGWSQSRMAEAAGVSRQSYAAIESGSSVPSTAVALRLAEALGRRVDELFRLPERAGHLQAAVWSGSAPPALGGRVRLTRVAGRWIAHPSAEAHRWTDLADGVVEAVEGSGVRIRLFPERAPSPALSVLGCDPGFGIVADELRRAAGIEVSWSQRGSQSALLALARGEAHVAGVHLKDPSTGMWNGPMIREVVPFPCARISFAVWEQGLVLRPGHRPQIGGVADLAAGAVRLLNREEGSGSRALLDEALAAAGVESVRVPGYATGARGHLSVAEGIAAGAADVGVAIRAASRAQSLDFLPIREEPYELVVPLHFLELDPVESLLRLLGRATVRLQVEALGGYDAAGMGSVVS